RLSRGGGGGGAGGGCGLGSDCCFRRLERNGRVARVTLPTQIPADTLSPEPALPAARVLALSRLDRSVSAGTSCQGSSRRQKSLRRRRRERGVDLLRSRAGRGAWTGRGVRARR